MPEDERGVVHLFPFNGVGSMSDTLTLHNSLGRLIGYASYDEQHRAWRFDLYVDRGCVVYFHLEAKQ